MTGARPSEGSSINNTFGLPTNARPIANICCSPPDNWLPRFCRRALSCGNIEYTRSPVHGPARTATAKFSSTVREENMTRSCGTSPSPFQTRWHGLAAVISFPFRCTEPLCRSVCPIIVISRVDLPTPLRPIILTASPARISRSIFSKAMVSP